MMVFPGLFLVLTTLAFNLVGDALRDALDPRGRAADAAHPGSTEGGTEGARGNVSDGRRTEAGTTEGGNVKEE